MTKKKDPSLTSIWDAITHRWYYRHWPGDRCHDAFAHVRKEKGLHPTWRHWE